MAVKINFYTRVSKNMYTAGKRGKVVVIESQSIGVIQSARKVGRTAWEWARGMIADGNPGDKMTEAACFALLQDCADEYPRATVTVRDAVA